MVAKKPKLCTRYTNDIIWHVTFREFLEYGKFCNSLQKIVLFVFHRTLHYRTCNLATLNWSAGAINHSGRMSAWTLAKALTLLPFLRLQVNCGFRSYTTIVLRCNISQCYGEKEILILHVKGHSEI